MATSRISGSVFCDTGVLLRYWTGDDPPRALAAAEFLERDDIELVISTGVLIEAIHALRTKYAIPNPVLADHLIGFLTRSSVRLADADKGEAVAALQRSSGASPRRVPDALIAAAAERAGCEAIATFDEAFASPSVAVRLL